MQNRKQTRAYLTAFIILHSAFCISLSGCQALGYAASAIPQNVKPRYHGLAGQSVGIIVWADRGIALDWGSVQLDLANAVQKKLVDAKTDEVKAITFPYEPKSYLRYLRDHPGSDALPITELAPHFGVSRLIYIELREFRTRSARGVDLFRGDASAKIQIVEIDPSGRGSTIAFTEESVSGTFPKHVPEDGMPDLGDDVVYRGEVDSLGTAIVNQLVTHEKEDH